MAGLLVVSKPSRTRLPESTRAPDQGSGASHRCARVELNQRGSTLTTLDVGHLGVDRQSRCLAFGTVPGRSCYPG